MNWKNIVISFGVNFIGLVVFLIGVHIWDFNILKLHFWRYFSGFFVVGIGYKLMSYTLKD